MGRFYVHFHFIPCIRNQHWSHQIRHTGGGHRFQGQQKKSFCFAVVSPHTKKVLCLNARIGGVHIEVSSPCLPGFSLDMAHSFHRRRNGYFTSISSTLILSNCRTGLILSGSLMVHLFCSCGSNNTSSLATNLAAFEKKKNCMNRLMDLKLFYQWGACKLFRCLLHFNITATCTTQAVASIACSLQCKPFTMILPLSLMHHWIILTVNFSSGFRYFFHIL